MANISDTETNPETLDLMGVLQGRTYPRDEVIVFTDERMMYELGKLNIKVDQNPADADLEEARNVLVDQFKEAALTIHIRGVSRHLLEQIYTEVNDKFPPVYNILGTQQPDALAVEELMVRKWELMVERVTSPSGAAMTPTRDDIVAMRGFLPISSMKAVDNAINVMADLISKTYEMTVQELGFLSQP
jgi:hypothetical protein